MTVDQMLTECLEKLLDAAYDEAYPNIPSRTLTNSMTKEVYGVGSGGLYIDQYWAIYLHDGRNKISKAPMIWFRNPNDDPRFANGYAPTRYSEVRALTPAEFKYWSAINRRNRARGLPEPMIVAWHGVAGTSGSYFFDNSVGMGGFIIKADGIVREVFSRFIVDEIGAAYFTPVTDPAHAVIS